MILLGRISDCLGPKFGEQEFIDLLANLSNACGVGRSVLIVGDDSLLML
jgi:hypothetical protein